MFYGDEWMSTSIHSVIDHVDKVLMVDSDYSWGGLEKKKEDTSSFVQTLINKFPSKIDVYRNTWKTETDQFNDALSYIRENHPDCTHLMILDTDEIYESNEIERLIQLTKGFKTHNKSLRVQMYTYIKSIYYRVSPIEVYQPLAIVPIRKFTTFSGARVCSSSPLMDTDIKMHHFSLVRDSDEKIKTKFSTRNDQFERVDKWFEQYFVNFSPDMENFHPIKKNRTQWKALERVNPENLPEGVIAVYNSWNKKDDGN